MDLLTKLVSYLPDIPFFKKSVQVSERFFALNIGLSQVTATVWWLQDHKIFTLEPTTLACNNEAETIQRSHLALDQSLADLPYEPKKIVFGVPSSFSQDDSLQEPHLKLLKTMSDQFDLTPIAFVTSAHALSHYLHQLEGVVQTVILLGLGEYAEASVIKSGKIIDSREMKRSGHLFEDMENLLMQFDSVEVLPSRILIYTTKEGEDLSKLKDEMVSYPWMNKLSFLHFPKIEVLDTEIVNKALVFAAAFEVDPEVSLKHSFVPIEEGVDLTPKIIETEGKQLGKLLTSAQSKLRFNFKISNRLVLLPVGLLILLIVSMLLIKAEVTVFVEPRVLEKDATVMADPKVTSVDENAKVIPGKIVETTVSGSDKEISTGKKEIGSPARGKVILYNLTSQQVSLSQGATVTSSNGLKFALDTSLKIASQSSTVGTDFTTVIKPGKSDPVGVTASAIGPDSNLPAGNELTVGSYAKSAVVAKVDEALAGGTSKAVTVVTSDDQKRLQAKLLAVLRRKAQEELQATLKGDQKIIADALTVIDGKYSYNKGLNDQASEFSLNATVRFKGTSYLDSDLKTIVAKLVETNVPDDFQLALSDSETSAAVSKVEKDDKLVFLARFKAKLLPKLDETEIKNRVRARPSLMAINSLKSMERVLGAEIVFIPNIPPQIGILPLLNRNIKVTLAPQ